MSQNRRDAWQPSFERPEVVVFDVGGVIVNWQPLDMMRRHFPEHAHDDTTARAVLAQVSQGFTPQADWGAFDLGRIEPDELARRIATRCGFRLEAVRALIDAIPAHLLPMPPSLAILERLRAQGQRLALLSNMPRPYAEHLERHHPCFGWFEHCTWSGRLGLMKPQREIFDHVQAALGVDDPSKLLFVDDHPGNIAAARALGWQAVHFRSAHDVADALGLVGGHA